jgi:antitoxin (DNA-binding transcriptional repressor) of toxin-antitoxin stability system
VATGGYIFSMTTVSIKEAKNRLTALTRNGKPVFDLVPHQARAGLRLEAIDEFKKKHGIDEIIGRMADDFDEPLPEDFLLKQLP